MKSVLITGAKGFLGSNVSKHFKTSGYKTYGIGHNRLSSSDSIDSSLDYWKEDNISLKAILEFKSDFDGRVVGFGTYDIHRPNGATHWVVIGGTDVNGHLSMHQDLEDNYTKAMNKYFEDRGEVEHVKDFIVEVLARY